MPPQQPKGVHPRMNFTSKELLALAHEQGYDFLTEDLLRQWVRLNVFPKAPRQVSPPGERRRYGVWADTDARWLLAACRLHAMHSGATQMRVGLWLLGYPVPNGETLIREQVTAALGDIRERLTGYRTLPQDDQGQDAAMAQLAQFIQASRIPHLLVLGAWPTLSDPDYNDIIELHPEMYAGTRRQQLEQAIWPEPTGRKRTLSTGVRGGDVEVLRVPESIEGPEYRYPRRDIRTEQQREVHERLVGDMLNTMLGLVEATTGPRSNPPHDHLLYDAGRQSLTLDELIAAVASADTNKLTFARVEASQRLRSAQQEMTIYAPIIGIGSIDLTALLEPYDGVFDLFFAAPKLFPLVAYLLAVAILSEPCNPFLSIRAHLLAFAVERIARRPKSRSPDADTLLALLVSAYLPTEALSSSTESLS